MPVEVHGRNNVHPTESHTSIQKELLGNGAPWRVGSYEIIRKVGEGSFSSVYLATHIYTRLEVVMKATDKNQPNIVAEVTNLRAFRHPHIIKLYELIVMPDKVWLVLEYCSGQDLLTCLIRDGSFPEARALAIFAQLCGAVAYTHSNSIAHRDLKLENVLLDTDWNVKLGDFGFTRNYSSRTMLETICGTGPYMAPELFNRKKYKPESADVWSLGIILYAVLYGQLPFDEDSEPATKAKILSGEPAYPPGVVSPGLEDLLKSMLQKDPRMRPKVMQILSSPVLSPDGQHQIDILRAPEPALFSTKNEKRVLKAMRTLHFDLGMLAHSVKSLSCDPLYGFWYTALDMQRRRTPGLDRSKSETRSLRSVARVARAIVRSPDSRGTRKNSLGGPSTHSSIHSRAGRLNTYPRSRSTTLETSAPQSPTPPGNIVKPPLSPTSTKETVDPLRNSRRNKLTNLFANFRLKSQPAGRQKTPEPSFQWESLQRTNLKAVPGPRPELPKESVSEKEPLDSSFLRPASEFSTFSISQISQLSEASTKESFNMNSFFGRHSRTHSGGSLPDEGETNQLPNKAPHSPFAVPSARKIEPRNVARRRMEAVPEAVSIIEAD